MVRAIARARAWRARVVWAWVFEGALEVGLRMVLDDTWFWGSV